MTGCDEEKAICAPARHDGRSARPIEAYYSLEEAAALFFPGGLVTKRSLRTEARKGRLRTTRIAGKDLVSESAIRAMLEACQCPAPEKVPGCGSAGEREEPANGSSSIGGMSIAQAAARQTLKELSGRLRRTS
jgi:hypothetical protein